MENLTVEHIIPLVEAHRYTGYFILFITMLIEGETFLIIAGILASLGAFKVVEVFFISLAGVLIGDGIWYYFGAWLERYRHGQKVIRYAKKSVLFLLPRFRETPFRSIFFSKFIYGANHAALIISGLFRVPFSLFMKAEFFASIVWVALFLCAGYFFGQAAVWVSNRATKFALIVLLFVLVFVLIQKLFAYYYERRQRIYKEEDHHAQW